MYLEGWMLFTLFIAWMISLFDFWRTGMHKGVDSTLHVLEQNSMILVDTDEEGNRIIRKMRRHGNEVTIIEDIEDEE